MIELNRLGAFSVITYVHIYNYYHTNGFAFVEIDKGVLRGSNATTWRGDQYFSFKGIPYAKPPVDEFRFKAPREETAWAGVRDALHHGDVCPQIDTAFQIFIGKEDCLFLNVYTPSLEEDKRMPVMVWIHGGMFSFGSGNDDLWGPDYLMKHGVVLVTINYRLGALGFLTTEDDDAPGNAALKDQVAALKWVKRNIAKFGGDPDNVTIFGGSSGATCVHYHILSPMSSGLFKKAILQSASAVHPWALSHDGVAVTMRLVEALAAKDTVDNKTREFEFLMAASPEDIVKTQDTLMTAREKQDFSFFPFTPSIEKNVKSEETFLSDSPLNIAKSGNFNKVPYIMGYNNFEGCFFKDEVDNLELMKEDSENAERFVPNDIRNKELRIELAKSIREMYFGDKPIGVQNISNRVNLYSDVILLAAMKRATKLHLQSVNAPSYFYVLSYSGKLNLVKFCTNINCPGAIHGDELGYLFHHRLLFWKNPSIGSPDEYVADSMIRLWTNFAKYGNPTPPGDSLTWKPVTLDEFNYLNISGWDTRADVNPDAERTNFWADAYERHEALCKSSECL